MIWLLPFLCSGLICWANRSAFTSASPSPSRPFPPAFAPMRTPLLAGSPRYLALPARGMTYEATGQVSRHPSAPPPQHRVMTAPVHPLEPRGPNPFPSVALPRHLPEGTFIPSPFAQGQGGAGGQGQIVSASQGAPFVLPSHHPHHDPNVLRFDVAPPVFAAAQPAPTPIAMLCAATDGCPIRPEPVAWDDAQLGRMPGAFTTPADYPIAVLSFGPVGWAQVLVNHPDDGPVQGWVETKFLKQPDASTSSTSSAPATSTTASTGADQRKQEMQNDALARHAMFMRARPTAVAWARSAVARQR